MAELKKGDKVRWRSGGGRASGTVERVITSRVKVGGRSVSGTKKEPRYLVRNADTGKAVVLKRPSLQKSGGRAAARKGGKATAGKAAPKRGAAGRTRRRAAAKPKPEPPPPAATAAEAEQKTQVLKQPPPKWPRWVAAGGLVVAVLVIGGLLLANDDDDDGGDDAEPAATVETTTAAEPSPELIAALESRPLALSGIETIPSARLGDEQEANAQEWESTYERALADLAELEQAATDNPEIAELAAFVTRQVEIERAITNSFVRNSFSDGDPASVLAEKTDRTEGVLRKQMVASRELDVPPEAAELERALTAARSANLTYLRRVAAAIGDGDQSALDAALVEGRDAAMRAGRAIARAATQLQDETEASVTGS